jgi:predicted RNase H-like HicB family nuclease
MAHPYKTSVKVSSEWGSYNIGQTTNGKYYAMITEPPYFCFETAELDDATKNAEDALREYDKRKKNGQTLGPFSR